MELLSKLRKIEKIRFYAGLILAGLILSVISGLALFMPHGEYLPVEATIVGKELDGTGSDAGYKFFIDYTAGGQTFRNVEFSSFDDKTEIGDKVTIEYDSENPANIRSEGGAAIPYVVLAAGLAALGFGAAKIGGALKQPAAELNEFNQVDYSRVTPEQAASVNTEEPWEKYYYHFTGKMNQSAVLETQDGRREVCYAEQMKMTALKPFIYEFRSRRTLKNVTREIGHTVSVTTGSVAGFRMPIKKSFTIDGVNNWEYLGSLGYSLEMQMQGLKPCFRVYRWGVEVASIETAGTDILKDGKDSLVGKLPTNGLFKVECAPSEADGVFLVCFCLDRALFLAD